MGRLVMFAVMNTAVVGAFGAAQYKLIDIDAMSRAMTGQTVATSRGIRGVGHGTRMRRTSHK